MTSASTETIYNSLNQSERFTEVDILTAYPQTRLFAKAFNSNQSQEPLQVHSFEGQLEILPFYIAQDRCHKDREI